jgi:hypothetical protein
MSLHVAVVAHVARTEQAKRLTDELGAELFMDDGSIGEWFNHRRALAWAATQDGHAVIVQDDALPVAGFLEHATRAASERPADMIGLYVGRQRPKRAAAQRAVRQADRTGASWLTAPGLWWGVATIVPCAAIPALLDAADAMHSNYDIRLGRAWLATQRRPVTYTWPSLVDHADSPSVIERNRERPSGRVAWRVGVPNWTGGTVAM